MASGGESNSEQSPTEQESPAAPPFVPLDLSLPKTSVKLAVVSHTWPPHSNGQAIVLARLLSQLGYEDCVLLAAHLPGIHAPRHSPDRMRAGYFLMPKDFSFKGGKLFGRIGLAQLVSNFCAAFTRANYIRRVVRENQCGAVVACTGEWFELPAAWWAARSLRVPMVVYVFDWYSAKFGYVRGRYGRLVRWLARYFEKRILKRCAAVVVPNEFLQHEYHTRYAIKPVLVRNSTDFIPDEEQNERPWPHDDRVIRIRYTGAIYEAHFDAVRALLGATARLNSDSEKNFQVEFFTDATPAFLAQHGIRGGVKIHTRVPVEEVAQVQRDADVLFLALAFESAFPDIIRTSAPGKLGDYLTSGRPILVTAPADSFVSWFFREHDCGLVVNSTAEHAVAAALQRLATDPELRERIVANANRMAAEFSAESSRERFFEIFEDTKFDRHRRPLPTAAERALQVPWPKISVVIPTYNRAHLVGDAIQSILDQNYPNLEIIVSDDGSTDNTREVVEELREKSGALIRYPRQANAGASAARNQGLRLATGDFVALLDSDDLFRPNKLYEQVSYMVTNPDCSLVANWCEFERGDIRWIYETKIKGEGYASFLGQALTENVCTPTVLIRRSALDAVGLFDESMAVAEDQDFFLRLADQGRLHVIPSALTCVRRHEGNMTIGLKPDVVYHAWEKLLTRAFAAHPELGWRMQRRMFAIANYHAWLIAKGNGLQRTDFLHSAFKLNPFSWEVLVALWQSHWPTVSAKLGQMVPGVLQVPLAKLKAGSPVQALHALLRPWIPQAVVVALDWFGRWLVPPVLEPTLRALFNGNGTAARQQFAQKFIPPGTKSLLKATIKLPFRAARLAWRMANSMRARRSLIQSTAAQEALATQFSTVDVPTEGAKTEVSQRRAA